MTKLRPTDDKIVLRIEQREEQDKSKIENKIIVPQTVQRDENIATIVAIGPKVSTELNVFGRLSVGMNVVYRPHSGLKVKVDDIDYLVVPQDAIWAVVK